MLLFSSILGALLSLILLWYNARKNASTIYLGVFFLLISLYGFYQYVLIHSKSVLLIEFLLVGFVFVFPPLYLIGPVVYWYTRSILADDFKLKQWDLIHLLPMIIFFFAALPYIFVPFSEKAEAARELVNDVSYMQYYKATWLSELFSVSAIYLSRPVLVLVYTIWSGVLCLRYFYEKKLSTVISKQRFMKSWICLLLISLFLLVVSHTLLIRQVFAMHFSELAFTLNVLRILSGAGIVGLLISPFFYPTILYGLPRVPQPESGKNKHACIKEANHCTPLLEAEYLRSIGEKTDSYMEKNEPYLQSGFNLNQLSVQIGIPVHHLGYYFREVKKHSFTEYRNRWRVDHAKKLIIEGKINNLTLEAIASISGFSNRNSFRTTFEKLEGITPSIFAAHVKYDVNSRSLNTI
jgi:AraC-like DNA-binding protein